MNTNRRFYRAWICIVAAIEFSCFASTLPARAEDPTARQIIETLKSKAPLTRSLAISGGDRADAADEQRFIDGLRSGGMTRSLTMRERDQVTDIAKNKPKLDLEINFGFDSDELTSKGIALATTLGQALSSSEMKGVTVFIAGHTDAKGGAEYNQDLSERRAATVKRFLIEKFGVAAENLLATGYGKERLKDPSEPYSGENRRVEVANLSGQAATRK
jgi:outer membrane protein OmpA-like peptidoglycan-associated protein